MLDICNFRMVHLQIWILNSIHAFYIKVIYTRETTDFSPPYMNGWMYCLSIMSKPRDCILKPLDYIRDT